MTHRVNITNLTLNTSNHEKFMEFKNFGLDCKRTSIDVIEPFADPITIIRYKATNVGENVLVEDSNFFVENTHIGVDIKYKMDELINYVNSPAIFDVWIGFMQSGKIYIYHGQTIGTIVKPVENVKGWGFDIYFQPLHSDFTFAQQKNKVDNPRYKAVQNLLNGKIYSVEEPLMEWEGNFQE